MDLLKKWVIVGSGGFVEGSFLPNADLSRIKGLIAHQPLKALGLCRAYGLKLYAGLSEAAADGVDTVYICSASWTHFDYVREAVKLGFSTIISEKPIIVDRSDFEDFKTLSPSFSGAMIKRAHTGLSVKSDQLRLHVRASSSDGPEVWDRRRGHYLMTELIHFVDAALFFCGPDADFRVDGDRISGALTFFAADKEATIRYDFSSLDPVNDLEFCPRLIRAMFDRPSEVIIPAVDLVRLYECLFEIEDQFIGHI